MVPSTQQGSVLQLRSIVTQMNKWNKVIHELHFKMVNLLERERFIKLFFFFFGNKEILCIKLVCIGLRMT